MKNTGLYYEVHGTQGPFLLMVHGLLSSKAQWTPNLTALCQHCRPVIIELFGHGRSPSPEDPKYYTPDNYSLEFERIRTELSAEKWFICGQSLGAALSLRYALNYPERITAQIFTNSRSSLTDDSMEEIMKALAKLLEEKGREIIDNFPLHPSKNKRLDPDIKNALIQDINLIDVNGFSNTCLRTGGVGPAVQPTGDIAKDMKVISSFYADISGKYPMQMLTALNQND